MASWKHNRLAPADKELSRFKRFGKKRKVNGRESGNFFALTTTDSDEDEKMLSIN